MKLSDLGEFGLIERFSPAFKSNLPADSVGIGDDCAVYPLNGTDFQLITTDMLVENIHFLRTGISALDLGYKSLAVNLSDIAGMGGDAVMCYLALALPGSLEVEWIDDFFRGFGELAETSGVSLMGGDITRSKQDIVINVTAIGKAEKSRIKYRSSAIAGDFVCLTDYTGESGAGLLTVLKNLDESELTLKLRKRHNRPRPHLEEGAFLSRFDGIHALMDVSDGVDSDLRHILDLSGVSAEIDLDRIPVSPLLRDAAENFELNAIETALTAGEDYCLLTTVDPAVYPVINSQFEKKFGRPLYNIGTIRDGDAELDYVSSSGERKLDAHGFDHFKSGEQQ